MPIYTYKCNYCGDLYEPYLAPDSDHKAVLDSGNLVCHSSGCHGQYRRRFNANVIATDGFGDGALISGEMVTSKRQLEDLNRRKSDEATERTGVEHNFQTVELSDMKPD